MVIAIFGNTLRMKTIREVKHIVEFLQLRGVDIVLSQELRHEAFNREFPSVEDYVSQTGETIDFALSVGGDGTFLTTASLVGHLDIPILGINCGHLGYLAEVMRCLTNLSPTTIPLSNVACWRLRVSSRERLLRLMHSTRWQSLNRG